MLSMRLKAALCTERVVISTVVFIIVSAVLLSMINAAKNANFHKVETSTTTTTTNGEEGINPDEYEIHDPGISLAVTSKTIADELLAKLLGKIGDGQGPIIVGGIGDSGTRGVRDVLMHFGTQMLGDGYINPVSKDSTVYMASYPTTTSKGKTLMRSPAGLYNLPIRTTHSLKYNSSALPFDFWHCGRQYVAKMVDRSLTISQNFRGKGVKLDPWGFKHPRTALLLPFWRVSLGDKFVFVHVLRDGKDIIEGDNQKVFLDVCHKYYGRKCADNLQSRINFWADLNRDVFEFALESDMKAHQYVAIRVEDLVLGKEPCFRRLAHYLNIPLEDLNRRIPEAIKANQGHESSYLGHKWSQELKNQVEHAMVNNKHTLKDFAFWGYKPDNYALSLECESLPWLAQMRAKKGPLPGDDLTTDNLMTSTPTTAKLKAAALKEQKATGSPTVAT